MRYEVFKILNRDFAQFFCVRATQVDKYLQRLIQCLSLDDCITRID